MENRLMIAWITALVVLTGSSFWIYGNTDDPLGLVRYLVRASVGIMLFTLLAIAAVRLFDHFTPPVRWIEKVSNDEMACAVVLAALVIGVFLVCVYA